jgi:uncharacterized protein
MATIPSTEQSRRIVTLDIVRGVAVMGILAMNIVAFAMPPQAYINPLAYGANSAVDLAVYAFNFVLIDGKMRGLFSFLFGASMLLVIQLAEQKGESARAVTLRRQLWLLFFGMIHFYLIWYGDILIGYALVGLIAYRFRNMDVRRLVRWGLILVFAQALIMAVMAGFANYLAGAVAGPSPSAENIKTWEEMTREIVVPSADRLREIMTLHLGPWTGIVREQVTEHAAMPFVFVLVFGWETLGYMLLGMAGLKSGFLTGEWSNRRYARWALICLAIAIPVYALLASRLFAGGFSPEGIFTWSFAATVPFRPLMIAAYAALIILATRGGGWLNERIAAAGRAAFTNYLGTSLVMTFVFYGWGLGYFGALSRAELWLVVFAMWVLMLAWSKPWLDRFNYGPFEWLWRSLARWKPQPMRKRLAPGTAAAGA